MQSLKQDLKISASAKNIETIAAHAGHDIGTVSKAVVSPICLSTTFERDADGSYPHGYIYSRNSNPNRAALEKILSQLEGGKAACAFSSGMAAISSVFRALLPGDHIIVPNDLYHGTARLLHEFFLPWGLNVTFVEMDNLLEVEQAIRHNTKIIWVETPSNPLLKIVDIRQISNLAHCAGAICVCDNTWATPVLQRPFHLGADLIVHSTTKYIGGHSDVMGGVVITLADNEFFQRIKKIQNVEGAVPSPFDCWLLLRGIQTLPYRMRAHSESAQKIACYLSSHPLVEKVYYPGLKENPGYPIAASQMIFFGGMLSFQVRGGRDSAMTVAAKVRIFTRATSLGGTVSLIEHRASIEGSATRTPDNLLRLSIGLEHADDLIGDLEECLKS